MVVAVPGRTSICGAWPQAITSALSASCFGAPSVAPAVSAARSAKPSTLARSNGGTSIGAARSCASTRPSAAASVTRSAGSGERSRWPSKALARLLGGDHFEELLLPRGLAHRGEQFALAARGCGLPLSSRFTATAAPPRARPADGLRCRPAPGSSLRRAPAPASTDSRCATGSTRPSRRRTGITSARPSGEAILRASSAANGCSSIRRKASSRQHAAADREPARERRVDAARQQQHRPRADEAERRGLAGRDADAVERDLAERGRACARWRRCGRCRCRRSRPRRRRCRRSARLRASSSPVSAMPLSASIGERDQRARRRR